MSGVWWLVGALLTQNLWKLPLGYNPLTWIMERHHYTHWFLQIQFSQRRKQVTSNAWSMRRRAAYVSCTYLASVGSPHIPCIILLYHHQLEISSVLLRVSGCILSLTMVCRTLLRCQPWHNDNIKLCHPAPWAQLVRWSKLPPSIMYNACIYIFTPFTTCKCRHNESEFQDISE